MGSVLPLLASIKLSNKMCLHRIRSYKMKCRETGVGKNMLWSAVLTLKEDWLDSSLSISFSQSLRSSAVGLKFTNSMSQSFFFFLFFFFLGGGALQLACSSPIVWANHFFFFFFFGGGGGGGGGKGGELCSWLAVHQQYVSQSLFFVFDFLNCQKALTTSSLFLPLMP